MNGRPQSAIALPAAQVETLLLATCGAWAVGIPVAQLARVAPAEAPTGAPGEPGVLPAESGWLGVLRFGGLVLAAWDLGRRWHRAPARGGWILARRQGLGVALRVDRCLQLAQAATAPLPPALATPGAGTCGFATAPLSGLTSGWDADLAPIGLRLDLGRLWSPPELAAARAAVGMAA
jgi:hypothetical protein